MVTSTGNSVPSARRPVASRRGVGLGGASGPVAAPSGGGAEIQSSSRVPCRAAADAPSSRSSAGFA